MKKINILKKIKLFTTLYIVVVFCSCSSPPTIKLIEDNRNSSKTYYFDYTNAFKNGFTVPSKQKDNIELFNVTLEVNNFSGDTLYYKIFYQNESYKFPEIKDGVYNVLASENFYGSWEDIGKTFEKIENKENPISISSFFTIAGNPRDEKKYYGTNSHKIKFSEQIINEKIQEIKSNKTWYKSIVNKAKINETTIEEQIKFDALFVLPNSINNRWQRNPRVGDYSLLVVITNKEGYNKISNEIKNISLNQNESFISPYYYFLHGEGKDQKNTSTFLVNNFITIKANVPLTNGIYVPYDSRPETFENKNYFNGYVGNSDELYANATFVYKHTYQANTESFMNIPVHAEFFNKGYSYEEYEKNIKIPTNKRIETFFTNTRFPGKTFGVDAEKKAIWFKNPANENGENRKENVGIKTRHGLTYGKYTYKIKMAKLLTKDNVWTGLTNAIWMINDNGKSNLRRVCEKEGFMPFYGAGKEEPRVPQIGYSEIDFEILKAAETWPRHSYPDKKERKEPESNKDKVMIACTNWDMACMQPDSFNIGVRQIPYKENTFNIHRWSNYYSALTSKVPALDEELFGGEYFYFQLEWKPTEIIWRVGPEKDKLRVVGYMNDKVTTIPNNQMLSIITQEYHFSKWWPKSPFKQEDIPFTAEDLKGTLYSIEIE